MPKILVAEDDIGLLAMLTDMLQARQYVVETATDGQAGLELLKLSRYDLLILDWDLPHVSGLALCKNYREGGGNSPVLMLTGKSDVEDKEEGLDAGADDYLTKPFSMRELSARIRALLRRPSQMATQTLAHGRLVVDAATMRAYKDGQLLELFPKEYAILEFLMRHPNQIFSAEALQERIWPSSSEASPDVIRVHVARLRSKLQTKGEKPIICTTYREGYSLDTTSLD